ncbi:MAG: aspartate carbamoyltransferase [Gammaproteobacteria bacterium]|nr:aspartate carbamoyltransferase [Gammaproteobacteria bacterium]
MSQAGFRENSVSVGDSTKLFHVIDPRNFERRLLDELCELATRVRAVAKFHSGALYLQDLLPTRRAMLYFTQPSTRTFLSFNNACHVLGMRTSEIRDPSTSSEVKGERFEDSIRTFSSYVDIIIMRTRQPGRAAQAARLMDTIARPIPVINAGSGSDQHPTQALLDIYTLEHGFASRGGIDGKVIGMMGDLKRGRTVRSLCYLIKNYFDVRLVFVAPKQFAMEDDVKSHLEEHGIPFTETERLEEVLPTLDALYVTRMQTEWDSANESRAVELERFSVGSKELAMLKPEALIMHPLPRGPEIDPAVDADPRAMYWRQERNGMWMRVAVLAKIFRLESRIQDLDPETFSALDASL